MEVKIKNNNELIDATIEMVDGVMVVSPNEVKFEPKDGDVCKSINCIYIFKKVKPSGFCNKPAIVYHCCYNGDYLKVQEDVGVGYIDRGQRYATEEEKKLLFDKLSEEGYEFDFDKKELVKIKWKPKVGEDYYTPSFSEVEFEPYIYGWVKDETDLKLSNKGWVFKTEQECKEFCDKLNKAIENIKP